MNSNPLPTLQMPAHGRCQVDQFLQVTGLRHRRKFFHERILALEIAAEQPYLRYTGSQTRFYSRSEKNLHRQTEGQSAGKPRGIRKLGLKIAKIGIGDSVICNLSFLAQEN